MVNSLKYKLYRIFNTKAIYIASALHLCFALLTAYLKAQNSDGTDFVLSDMVITSITIVHLLSSMVFIVSVSAFKTKGYIINMPGYVKSLVCEIGVDIIMYVIISHTLIAVTVFGQVIGLVTNGCNITLGDFETVVYKYAVWLLLLIPILMIIKILEKFFAKQTYNLFGMVIILFIIPIFTPALNMYLIAKEIVSEPNLYELITASQNIDKIEVGDLYKTAIAGLVYIGLFAVALVVVDKKDKV